MNKTFDENTANRYIVTMNLHIDFSSNQLDFDRAAKPLYVQIEELLHGMIKRGVFRKGDLLPPINEIAKQLDVNRITVRQAMQHLAKVGVVKSYRGKGTIVTADSEFYPKMTMKTKLEAQMSSADGTEIDLLSSEKCDAHDCTFVAVDEQCNSYQKLLRINKKMGRPITYVTLFIASRLFDANPERFERRLALRATIASLGKENIARIHQHLTIGTASRNVAKYLNITTGSPVADVHRFVHDSSNKVAYAANLIYPGDYIEVIVDTELE